MIDEIAWQRYNLAVLLTRCWPWDETPVIDKQRNLKAVLLVEIIL
jgi:hypothetical protein